MRASAGDRKCRLRINFTVTGHQAGQMSCSERFQTPDANDHRRVNAGLWKDLPEIAKQ